MHAIGEEQHGHRFTFKFSIQLLQALKSLRMISLMAGGAPDNRHHGRGGCLKTI